MIRRDGSDLAKTAHRREDLTVRRNPALGRGAPWLLAGVRLGRAARDVLVKNAGNERLLGHAFLKGLDLSIAQAS